MKCTCETAPAKVFPPQFYTRRAAIIYKAIGGAIIGGFAAAILHQLANLDGLVPWICAGIFVGFAAGPPMIAFCLWWSRESDSVHFVDTVEVAGISFRVTSAQSTAAWHLFIETMTRAATQPIHPEHGTNREALSSLHSLFETARKILRDMPPSQHSDTKTVELLAIEMLNHDLRPFLSKWHPLLKVWEADSSSPWLLQSSFRAELEILRARVEDRARVFGQIARVHVLENFFKTSQSQL